MKSFPSRLFTLAKFLTLSVDRTKDSFCAVLKGVVYISKTGRPKKDLTSAFFALSPHSEVVRLSMVLYCPLEFLRQQIFIHQDDIFHYAFIFHDMDEKIVEFEGEDIEVLKQPHFHLLLFLNRKIRISSVLRWFFRIDENGLTETVTAVGISNPELAYAYLTHKYDRDKFQYPQSRVKTSSKAFFENLSSRSSDDSLTNAFYDRQAGAGVDELIKKYGRDFILHYDKIMHLCRISALENERKRSSGRIDFFEELYEIN